jgi:hypothetical protein
MQRNVLLLWLEGRSSRDKGEDAQMLQLPGDYNAPASPSLPFYPHDSLSLHPVAYSQAVRCVCLLTQCHIGTLKTCLASDLVWGPD